MRIVIADEHVSFRDALKVFLQTDPSLTLVGEADSVASLLDVVAAQHPDVVIMEASSPELPGIELIPLVRDLAPQVQVIVLSTDPTTAEASTAAQSGAVAYLSKDLVVRDLFDALWGAHQSGQQQSRSSDGRPPVPGATSAAAWQPPASGPDHDGHGPDHNLDGFILSIPSPGLESEESGVGRLSRYERRCLSLLAEGRTVPEMAEALDLPVTALELCQRRVMVKLGAETFEQLRGMAIALAARGALA